jgi:hypothetical protein
MAPVADFPPPRDWKVTATIHRIDPERRYCHAIDSHGVEYFIFYNAFQTTDYRDITHVEIGTHVRLTPIENPGRGFRGIEVEIVEI